MGSKGGREVIEKSGQVGLIKLSKELCRELIETVLHRANTHDIHSRIREFFTLDSSVWDNGYKQEAKEN